MVLFKNALLVLSTTVSIGHIVTAQPLESTNTTDDMPIITSSLPTARPIMDAHPSKSISEYHILLSAINPVESSDKIPKGKQFGTLSRGKLGPNGISAIMRKAAPRQPALQLAIRRNDPQNPHRASLHVIPQRGSASRSPLVVQNSNNKNNVNRNAANADPSCPTSQPDTVLALLRYAGAPEGRFDVALVENPRAWMVPPEVEAWHWDDWVFSDWKLTPTLANVSGVWRADEDFDKSPAAAKSGQRLSVTTTRRRRLLEVDADAVGIYYDAGPQPKELDDASQKRLIEVQLAKRMPVQTGAPLLAVRDID